MKKLFALLLTLALLLSSAAMAEYDYTGLWTLTGAEVEGIPIDIAAIGLDASILLKEDGSCVQTLLDETYNVTWVATTYGVTVADAEGGVDNMKLVDNNLVVDQDGVKLTFAREKERAIYHAGTWTLTDLEVNDTPQELSSMGISGGTTVIEDDACVLSVQDESGAEMLGVRTRIQDGKTQVELARNGVTEVHEAICTITDMGLTNMMVDFRWTDSANGEMIEDSMLLTLFSHGRLFWVLTDEAGNRVFYIFKDAENIPES